MKNTKIYKHHYDYHDFDTNIPDYVEYIVSVNRAKMEQCSNVVNDFISFSYSLNDHKITWQMFYNYLYDEGYSLSEIKQYYNQLKDILMEHNNELNSSQHVQHEIDKRVMEERVKDRQSMNNAIALVDTFGATTIENDNGNKYVLTNAMVKERKTKK